MRDGGGQQVPAARQRRLDAQREGEAVGAAGVVGVAAGGEGVRLGQQGRGLVDVTRVLGEGGGHDEGVAEVAHHQRAGRPARRQRLQRLPQHGDDRRHGPGPRRLGAAFEEQHGLVREHFGVEADALRLAGPAFLEGALQGVREALAHGLRQHLRPAQVERAQQRPCRRPLRPGRLVGQARGARPVQEADDQQHLVVDDAVLGRRVAEEPSGLVPRRGFVQRRGVVVLDGGGDAPPDGLQ